MMQVENLHYSAGDTDILHDVSLAIEPGNVTAILGPNGAGKSTLLNCLTGALTPTEGRVILNEQDLADYSLEALAKQRAVMSQSVPVNFPFTAEEIVTMGRNPYTSESSPEADAKLVKSVLKKVGAWDLKDRIFPTLSGGEQQRVHLARALTQIWQQKKAMLFLDEPTSALDLKHQHHVLKLLKTLAAKNKLTICLVIHDPQLALLYCDHAILLRDGKLFKAGEVKKTLTRRTISTLFDVPQNYITLPKS